MKAKKQNYQALNLFRIFACLAILFYHLNILKGGYLAVCSFFVLSGYLSCISSLKKQNFSFKEYYINRLKKIYVPLLLVVFLSLTIINFLPQLSWLNLKPEVTSIILGYNNFWQLSVNLDYFARHIDSPFMHFWYIAILLQYDLVFPFIYVGLKKVAQKFHKMVSVIVPTVLGLASLIFFLVTINTNIMAAYYNTLTRIYPLFFGLALGFYHSYNRELIPKKLKKKPMPKRIFIIYLILLSIMFIFINASAVLMAIGMVLTTLISLRLIDYSRIIKNSKNKKLTKLVNTCSNCSYEIYLWQYPIIYLFSIVKINWVLKIILIIILTLILSYGTHLFIDLWKKEAKNKLGTKIVIIVVLILTLIGVFTYIKAKNHTKEMNELEELLTENAALVEKRQAEYQKELEQAEAAWNETLNNMDVNEEELKAQIKNLPIVGVGDSVMLGAVPNLTEEFPKGYFDAKISRTGYAVNDILKDLESKNMLGNPIVLHLGTNGDCSQACKEEILKTIGDREVFWLNVTNDAQVHVNDRYVAFANSHSNVHLVDWNKISSGHSEYFYADGIHLRPAGRKAYQEAIFNAIYDYYVAQNEAKKEAAIKEHEAELKNNYTFYGNELLLNIFDNIEKDYQTAQFNIDKEYNLETLTTQIANDKQANKLNQKLVLVLDNLTDFTFLENLGEYQIYVVAINTQALDNLKALNLANVNIIDFTKEIAKHDYLLIDGIHLNKKGNLALSKLVKAKLEASDGKV